MKYHLLSVIPKSSLCLKNKTFKIYFLFLIIHYIDHSGSLILKSPEIN